MGVSVENNEKKSTRITHSKVKSQLCPKAIPSIQQEGRKRRGPGGAEWWRGKGKKRHQKENHSTVTVTSRGDAMSMPPDRRRGCCLRE